MQHVLPPRRASLLAARPPPQDTLQQTATTVRVADAGVSSLLRACSTPTTRHGERDAESHYPASMASARPLSSSDPGRRRIPPVASRGEHGGARAAGARGDPDEEREPGDGYPRQRAASGFDDPPEARRTRPSRTDKPSAMIGAACCHDLA